MSNEAKVPKIRFKGFTDAWEQRNAGFLFNEVSKKGFPHLPMLSATQEQGMIIRSTGKIQIQHKKENEVGYKRVCPGQFVIHLRSFQGGFAHSTVEGITSPAYTVFRLVDDDLHNDKFWKIIFSSRTFIKSLEKVTYGIRDGRSISYPEFTNLNLTFPCKLEQDKISRIVFKLNDVIALHQCKLEKLKNIKKSLLEKMFV